MPDEHAVVQQVSRLRDAGRWYRRIALSSRTTASGLARAGNGTRRCWHVCPARPGPGQTPPEIETYPARLAARGLLAVRASCGSTPVRVRPGLNLGSIPPARRPRDGLREPVPVKQSQTMRGGSRPSQQRPWEIQLVRSRHDLDSEGERHVTLRPDGDALKCVLAWLLVEDRTAVRHLDPRHRVELGS